MKLAILWPMAQKEKKKNKCYLFKPAGQDYLISTANDRWDISKSHSGGNWE